MPVPVFARKLPAADSPTVPAQVTLLSIAIVRDPLIVAAAANTSGAEVNASPSDTFPVTEIGLRIVRVVAASLPATRPLASVSRPVPNAPAVTPPTAPSLATATRTTPEPMSTVVVPAYVLRPARTRLLAATPEYVTPPVPVIAEVMLAATAPESPRRIAVLPVRRMPPAQVSPEANRRAHELPVTPAPASARSLP